MDQKLNLEDNNLSDKDNNLSDKDNNLSDKDKNLFQLTMIPVLDMGKFRHVLSLPLPTKENTYGFRWYHSDTIIYSPIDIIVAVKEHDRLKLKLEIKNLKSFFDKYTNRLSESEISLGLVTPRNNFVIRSIAYWKKYLDYLKNTKNTKNSKNNEYTNLRKLLKDNGPLTFWEM